MTPREKPFQIHNFAYVFEGCEEENDQPPPLEKVDAAAICDDDDLGGLGEALLKEIAEAVQVRKSEPEKKMRSLRLIKT